MGTVPLPLACHSDAAAHADHVITARLKRRADLVQASALALALRGIVVLVELMGVGYFYSSAILADALGSLLDMSSTVLLIVCIRLASRPPDANHPFGHGRFEPLAGLQLGVLLVILGAVLAFQEMGDLFSHVGRPPLDPRTWMIPLMATLLLEIGYRIAIRTAKQSQSPALVADAWHYRIDALHSLVATIALAAGAVWPQVSVLFDQLSALCIAVIMIIVGVGAVRNNLHQLTDRIPSQEWFDRVRAAAMRVEGICDTEKLAIQQYGPDAHVDIDVEVDPRLSVEEAHRLARRVRIEIQRVWPAVRNVVVHVEPFYTGDH